MLMLVTLLLLPCSSAKLSNSVFDFLRETEPTPIVIWHGMGKIMLSKATSNSISAESLGIIQLARKVIAYLVLFRRQLL